MSLKTLRVVAMAVAILFPLAGHAGDKGYNVVKEAGYAYRVVTDGPLEGRVAWAFDKPKGASDPLGLLLQHLRDANDVIWASYKPTHPDIASALNGHAQASGVYDLNYCGDRCMDAYAGNERVKPVSLGTYKSKSRRPWFVMHHKFAVLNNMKAAQPDNAAVLTGSFNWNERAAALNYENIVYVQSRKIADAYWREFERVNGRGKGNAGPVSDGDITAAFNKDVVALLTQRIDAASTSILAAVWSISVDSKKNPNPVYEALKAAAARGVEVRIVTDAHKAKKRKYGSLDIIRAHMPTKKGHMHHKFMIIDAEYVVTGSANFVTKAFSGNDENMVAIRSPAMATSFTNHWKTMVKAVQ